MDDFLAYRLYRATKLHFTQKSYDVFITKGAVKGLTREYFETRKEAPWFRSLSKKFDTPKEYCQFCVAQVAYGSLNDIFDLDTAQSNYKEWTKNKQKLTQLIVDELQGVDVDSLITGFPPNIIKKSIAKKIHIETAVAINRHRPFISDAILKKDYLIISEEALKIKKMDKFIKYNTEVISDILGPLNTVSVGGGGLENFNMENPSN